MNFRCIVNMNLRSHSCFHKKILPFSGCKKISSKCPQCNLCIVKSWTLGAMVVVALCRSVQGRTDSPSRGEFIPYHSADRAGQNGRESLIWSTFVYFFSLDQTQPVWYMILVGISECTHIWAGSNGYPIPDPNPKYFSIPDPHTWYLSLASVAVQV